MDTDTDRMPHPDEHVHNDYFDDYLCAQGGSSWFFSASSPDKQWSTGLQEIPQLENTIYGRAIIQFKTHQKKSLHMLRGLERVFEVQRNLCRALTVISSPNMISLPQTLNYYKFFFHRSPQLSLIDDVESVIFVDSAEFLDPQGKFVPSGQLIELVRHHIVRPGEETLQLLGELQEKAHLTEEETSQSFARIITEQVEALFTSLAQRLFETGEPLRISKDNRFTPDICNELINRLGLDAYNPRPVLELLYSEFLNFISAIPRERTWGKIVVENSELKLILKDRAFIFPALDKITDDKWIVT